MENNSTVPEETTAGIDTSADFGFDLARISLDEMLDVLDFDETNYNQAAIGKVIRALRKCLVRGSRPLTGADIKPVVQGFFEHVFGGTTEAKN